MAQEQVQTGDQMSAPLLDNQDQDELQSRVVDDAAITKAATYVHYAFDGVTVVLLCLI